jgi:hypothetical protein
MMADCAIINFLEKDGIDFAMLFALSGKPEEFISSAKAGLLRKCGRKLPLRPWRLDSEALRFLQR